MEILTEILLKDVYKHIYIIRGIIQNTDGFQMIVINEKPLEYLAIWPNDLAITYFNEEPNLNEMLKSYFGNYDFVDLNCTIGNLLLKNYLLDMSSFYDIKVYYLMRLLNTSAEKSAQSETMRDLSVNKVKSKSNIKHIFKSSDGIEIGSVVIEFITEEFKAISNLYVSDQFRNMGYAKAIMQTTLDEYHDCDLVLYVEEKNNYALHLYETLGFKIVDKYMNFEMKGGE